LSLQERPLLRQGFAVQGELPIVARVALRESAVEHRAPGRRRPVDELDIARREDHGPNAPEVAGELPRLAIDPVRLAHPARRGRDLACQLNRPGRYDRVAAHERTGRAVPDELTFTGGPKRLPHGEHPDRFQEITLPLSVLPDEDVESGREVDREVDVVAKIKQAQAAQPHGLLPQRHQHVQL
jgi:hypothetical protein